MATNNLCMERDSAQHLASACRTQLSCRAEGRACTTDSLCMQRSRRTELHKYAILRPCSATKHMPGKLLGQFELKTWRVLHMGGTTSHCSTYCSRTSTRAAAGKKAATYGPNMHTRSGIKECRQGAAAPANSLTPRGHDVCCLAILDEKSSQQEHCSS